MKPLLIIIGGPMGAGKTTVAKIIHPKLKRTAMISLDAFKWMISDYQRSVRDNKITRDVMLAMCAEYLRQGISVMLAQSFKTPMMRLPFLRLAKRLKVPIVEYRLEAERNVLLKRIKNRHQSKSVRTPLAPSRIIRNLRLYAKYQYPGAMIIETPCKTPEEVKKIILADLNKRLAVLK